MSCHATTTARPSITWEFFFYNKHSTIYFFTSIEAHICSKYSITNLLFIFNKNIIYYHRWLASASVFRHTRKKKKTKKKGPQRNQNHYFWAVPLPPSITDEEVNTMIKIAGIKSNDKINFKEFVDFFYIT